MYSNLLIIWYDIILMGVKAYKRDDPELIALLGHNRVPNRKKIRMQQKTELNFGS